jgi:6-phosphogluconolactonase
VKSDGTLGTETAYPTCNNPVAVNVLASGKAVYVVNDPSGQLTTLIDTMAAVNRGATGGATVIYPSAGACLGGAGAKGQISGYTVSSNNTLTPAAGSPFSAGTAPNAITSDPSSSFLYVTDFATSQMYSYAVQTSDGALSPLANAQATGQSPSAVTTVAIAPGNKYIYVANYGANTVSGFSIGQGGTPTALPGTSNISAVDAGPASVLIENSDRYVYTANFIAGTVSSLYLDPNAGTFHPGQRTPFPGVAKATAVASVKHHTI